MKKLLLLLTIICASNWAMAQAPCIPGTLSTTGGSYILPDSATNLVHGCAGMNYEEFIYLKAPKDTTFTVASIPINATVDSFVVDANVVGLPAGITVSTNPALLPPNASSSKTNFARLVIPGDSIACVKLSGLLPATLAPGDINLTINIRAYLSGVPFPLGPMVDTPAVIDYYKITIDAPGTGTCIPFSTKDVAKNNVSQLSLSPNPVQDILQVQMDINHTANYNLSIVDLIGRAIISRQEKLEAGHNSLPISMGHLPNGIYFLKLSSSTSSLSKKIIVQH